MKAQKGGKARYPNVFEITVIFEYKYTLLALPLLSDVDVTLWYKRGEIYINIRALRVDPGSRKFKLNNYGDNSVHFAHFTILHDKFSPPPTCASTHDTMFDLPDAKRSI
jgi:hypothetical protein